MDLQRAERTVCSETLIRILYKESEWKRSQNKNGGQALGMKSIYSKGHRHPLRTEPFR